MKHTLMAFSITLLCLFAHAQSSISDDIISRVDSAKHLAEINPFESIRLCYDIFKQCRSQGRDSLLSHAYSAMTEAQANIAMYDSARTYAFMSLRKAEVYKDTTALIDARNNLGIISWYQDDLAKAEVEFELVEELAREFDDAVRLGHALTNLGIISGYKDELEKELAYYEKAATIFSEIGDKDGYANVLLNIGTVYTIKSEFSKAADYYKEAQSIFEGLGNIYGVQNALQNLAENDLKSGNAKSALVVGHKALKMADENDFVQDQIYALQLLRGAEVKLGRFENAYEYLAQEVELEREVFSTQKARQMQELDKRYETEKKEAEIARLSLENKLKVAELARSRNAQFAVIIGAAALIMILLVLFVLRQRKIRTERETHELRMEAMEKRFADLLEDGASPELKLDFETLNLKLHNPLSVREFEALTLSLSGKTNAQISEELFISVNTVKFHLRNVYNKLGVTNRKEALEYVIKKG